MKISLFTQNGALNSLPVFQSFAEGTRKNGHEVVENKMDADVAVIWSMLWMGKMRNNRPIYQNFRSCNKPVVVLEIGCLNRNETWKVGLNGLSLGSYEWSKNIERPKMFCSLKDYRIGDNILICSQNPNSELWKNQPPMGAWIDNTVSNLRKITERKIIVRTHPRFPVNFNQQVPGVSLQKPNMNSFDKEFIRSLDNVRLVINHNSNPGVVAAINGLPVLTGDSSLAYPINQHNLNLENLELHNREEWFYNLHKTEFTCEELSTGEITSHLYNYITSNFLK